MDPLTAVGGIASAITVGTLILEVTPLALNITKACSKLDDLDSNLAYLQDVADTLQSLKQVRDLSHIRASILQRPFDQLRVVQDTLSKDPYRVHSGSRGKRCWARALRPLYKKELAKSLSVLQRDFQTAFAALSACKSSLSDLKNHSAFELSSTFSPAHYVATSPLMGSLMLFFVQETHRTNDYQLRIYHMLFIQDRRRWCRIVAKTLTRTTAMIAFSGPCRKTNRNEALGPLLAVFQHTLTKHDADICGSITQIEMEVASDDKGTVCAIPESIKVSQIPEDSMSNHWDQYLNEIFERGYRTFIESQVTVVESLGIHGYLVHIGDRPFFERRVPFTDYTSASADDGVSEFWYGLQPLLALQGSPFIARVGGFVLCDKRKRVCSYLIDLPQRGTLIDAMYTAKQAGHSIPWHTKERWIRQLATAIAEAHRRGVVIGCLHVKHIWLDSNGDVVIVEFERRSEDLRHRPGEMSPEFRSNSAADVFYRAEAVPGHMLTFKSDMFAQGIAIWLICEELRQGQGVFCRRSPCTSRFPYQCLAAHNNPVELPPFSPQLNIPPHIETIVSKCRQADPAQRPTAAAILDILSSNKSPDVPLVAPALPILSSPMTCVENRTYCSNCGKICTFDQYNCSVCDNADFDLCPDCYRDGVVCFDKSHLLHHVTMRSGQKRFEAVIQA